MSAIILQLPVNVAHVDEGELAQAQRSYLAEEAACNPPRASTLIAMLTIAEPGEREAIIKQLEARK